MVNQYCAHSFTRNWQLSFWTQRKGENDHRKYFMIKSPWKTLAYLAGAKPTTSWSPVALRLATFLSKSRVCNSSYKNLISVIFMHMRSLFSYFAAILKIVEVAETQALLCHVCKAIFLNKLRVCNSSNKHLIRVLWPLCTAQPTCVVLLCCKFQIIILKTVEVADTNPYYAML